MRALLSVRSRAVWRILRVSAWTGRFSNKVSQQALMHMGHGGLWRADCEGLMQYVAR